MCQTWSVSLLRENIAILNHTQTVQLLLRLWLSIPKNSQAELVFQSRDTIPRCSRSCVSPLRGPFSSTVRSLSWSHMLPLSPRRLLPITLERTLLKLRNNLRIESHWIMIKTRNGWFVYDRFPWRQLERHLQILPYPPNWFFWAQKLVS